MWQTVRDYWLPMMLFAGSLLIAGALLAFVGIAPFLPFRPALVELFSEDATVRRSAIAGAIGLIVTAFLFFRPKAPSQVSTSEAERQRGS